MCKSYSFPTEVLFDIFKVLCLNQLYVKPFVTYKFKNFNNILLRMFEILDILKITNIIQSFGIKNKKSSKTFSITNSHFIVHVLNRSLPDILCIFTIINYRIRQSY